MVHDVAFLMLGRVCGIEDQRFVQNLAIDA
jgi:hypothetical protein